MTEACSLDAVPTIAASIDALVEKLRAEAARSGRRADADGLAGVKVERAKEMMLRDLSQPVPLADVASACGFSYHHFIATFRAAVGVTPYAWVTNQRVIAAQKLMLDHPKMRLVDIALSVGFGEQRGLGRVFKNREGTTPDAWRRRQLAARAIVAVKPHARAAELSEIEGAKWQ